MSNAVESREILVSKKFLFQCESLVGKVDSATGKVFRGVSGRLFADGFYHLKAEFREFDEKRDSESESIDFSATFAKYGPTVESSAEAAKAAVESGADVVDVAGKVTDMTIKAPPIEDAIAKPGTKFEDGSVMGEQPVGGVASDSDAGSELPVVPAQSEDAVDVSGGHDSATPTAEGGPQEESKAPAKKKKSKAKSSEVADSSVQSE